MDDEDVHKHPFNNSQSKSQGLAAKPGKDQEESCAFPSPQGWCLRISVVKILREVSKTSKEAVAT